LGSTGGRANPRRPTVAEFNSVNTGNGDAVLEGVALANGRAGDFVQVGGTVALDQKVGTIRYFAVDYDGGSDTNLGFSDTSAAAAGLIPLKTIEELLTRLPTLGLGRRLQVLIKRRAGGAAYLAKDGITTDSLSPLLSSTYRDLLVRGTATDTTAASTAFADDAADRVFAGARQVTGTNAAGYNAIAPRTAAQFDVQLAGGGAPGFVADAYVKKRIRFDAATTTAGLRNQCRMIWQNAAGNITVNQNLTAVPVDSDVFYIEEPGIGVQDVLVAGSSGGDADVFGALFVPDQAPQIQIVGIRAAGRTAILGNSAEIDLCFDETATFHALNFGHIIAQNFYLPSSAFVGPTPGTGIGISGAFSVKRGLFFLWIASGSTGTASKPVLDEVLAYNWGGNGGVGAIGVRSRNSGLGNGASALYDAAQIGSLGTGTFRRLRITAGSGNGAIDVVGGSADVIGADATNIGARPIVRFAGVGVRGAVDDVIGATGNTDVGLDVSAAKGAEITAGLAVANTGTGNAGDIRFAGTAIGAWADLTITNVKDNKANNVQGTAGAVVGQATLVVNKDGGALAVGDQVKGNGTTSQVVAAKADTTAESASLLGAMVTAPANNANGYMVSAGIPVCTFDGAPTVGAIAYLSPGTAKDLTTTVPAVAGTNQRLRVGRVVATVGAGTQATVTYHPESLAVVATGLP